MLNLKQTQRQDVTCFSSENFRKVSPEAMLRVSITASWDFSPLRIKIKIPKPLGSNNPGCHAISNGFPATLLGRIQLVAGQASTASRPPPSFMTLLGLEYKVLL
jgi:hypothetical protein